MLKFNNAVVTFAEVPEEVTLCINITGCPIHCEDCHSPELWEDTGELLDEKNLSLLIDKNKGITCICFMGGDSDPNRIYELAAFIKARWNNLKTCWYSGATLRKDFPFEYFDYIKTGPYKKELGGLDSVTTNQRFYAIVSKYAINSDKVMYRYLEDITFKFQKNNIYYNKNRDYQNNIE